MRARAAAPPRSSAIASRGKLPVRERIDLLLDSGHGVARALAARGLRRLRRRGAGRRARHGDRHGLRSRVRDRGQRRHRQGRLVLPADGQEAPPRAGDRAREPPAVHLPRRLRRRLPPAPGRGLPRPRPLRAHLLQPGAHVVGRHPAARRGHGLVHRRRRLRACDVRSERDRPGHGDDLPRGPAAREGRDGRGGHRRGARRRRRARAHLGRGRRARELRRARARAAARGGRGARRTRPGVARAARARGARPTTPTSSPASSRPTSARRSMCAR